MQRIGLILAILTCVLTSCDKELPNLQSTTLQWESVTYASKKIGDFKCYIVPQEGGVYTFVCSNYNNLVYSTQDSFTCYDLYDNDTCTPETVADVKINNKVVTITIAPNDTSTRYPVVGFFDPGHWGRIYFVQEGVK